MYFLLYIISNTISTYFRALQAVRYQPINDKGTFSTKYSIESPNVRPSCTGSSLSRSNARAERKLKIIVKVYTKKRQNNNHNSQITSYQRIYQGNVAAGFTFKGPLLVSLLLRPKNMNNTPAPLYLTSLSVFGLLMIVANQQYFLYQHRSWASHSLISTSSSCPQIYLLLINKVYRTYN